MSKNLLQIVLKNRCIWAMALLGVLFAIAFVPPPEGDFYSRDLVIIVTLFGIPLFLLCLLYLIFSAHPKTSAGKLVRVFALSAFFAVFVWISWRMGVLFLDGSIGEL